MVIPEYDEYEGRRHDKPKREASFAASDGSASPEIYVFGRAEGFYMLELKDDADAIENAECNPGTQNVSTIGGRPVWPNNQAQRPERE